MPTDNYPSRYQFVTRLSKVHLFETLALEARRAADRCSHRILRFAICFALLPFLLYDVSHAGVRLPGFFGDRMVLQQDMMLRIWGWADANEAVEVTLGDNVKKTVAGADGRWRVELAPMKASSEPHVLRVSGSNTIEFKDVLIGEVWLCSGQSNMEWSVRASSNSKEEIAAADYPLIRHIKIPLRPSTIPLDDTEADWQTCSPETVPNFTAAGYFMARRLQKELNVPIGLVNASWGGTRVEPWTAPVGFQEVAALQDIYQSVVGRTPGHGAYRERLAKHIAETEEWLTSAKNGFESNQAVPAHPSFPAELMPFRSHQDPAMLYNGMIHALVGFPIRGAIWYQGESNHTEGMMYFEKKKALINGWRKLWQQNIPFYFVQVAPFKYGNEDPTILAEFWEAQAAVQQIPHTGMVVINDIATVNDIHPPNKQDVGTRLALWALKNEYGRSDLVASGPGFDSLEVHADRMKLKFKNTAGGLKTRDGKAPSHFEVTGIGTDGFKPATAKIEGDTVILHSDDVAAPLAFRFAWHSLAEPNLMGGTGLPVGAVRGGKVPTFMESVPGFEEYKLVYDLDLSKMNATIKYDVDNSGHIDAFDRIGYLLELESDAHGKQHVFVATPAFTKDIKKVGIPTVESDGYFQQELESLDVFTNVRGLTSGTKIETGNIEFFPYNYAPTNKSNVHNASGDIYDFGDEAIKEPKNGYGSMQIHNYGARQTIFAINHWTFGDQADLGIGNSDGDTRDWTFKRNAGTYSKKRLRIFVRANSN